jgi:hypothetical protein
MQRARRRSKPSPFYQQGWFLGIGAAVGLAGAVLGLYQGFKEVIKPELPTKYPDNTEIVFDRSLGMKELFEAPKTTKIEAGREAVTLLLRDAVLDSTNLAFREFGGACEGASAPLPIPFRPDNRAAVEAHLAGLEPDGRATLFNAIREAIGDFADISRFAGMSKEIIVITGGEDACQSSGPSWRNIQHNLAASGAKEAIKLDFHFIGIGLSIAAKAQLNALATKTAGEARFADNLNELRHEIRLIALRTAPEIARLRDGLESEIQQLNPVINDLRDATNVDADVPRNAAYVKAEEHLAAADRAYAGLEATFAALGAAFADDHHRRIFATATSVRDCHHRMLLLAATIIEQHQRGDVAATAGSTDAFANLRAECSARQAEFVHQMGEFESPNASQ